MTIETATEIHTEVAAKVQDTFFDIDDTISYINKGLKEIAGYVLLPKLLEVDTTIDTVVDTAYASLPDTFMKNLHYCYSNDHNRKINIYDDVRLLYREFSQLDLSGSVIGVARKGNSLYYQRIPSSAETLRIHFYKYPTELSVGSDQPDCLPEFLVRPLLFNYVCREMYNLIEDGIEGAKINTDYHTVKFNEALGQLASYIGPEPREPQYTVDDMDLENYI